MKLLAVLATVAALAGCASMFSPYNSTDSAAQIKAMASDNKVNVACQIVPTPWGMARSLVVSADETGQTNADVQAKGDCSELAISTTKPYAPKVNALAPLVPAPTVAPRAGP